jgi:tetratricopeptide (TPR) repeat protein
MSLDHLRFEGGFVQENRWHLLKVTGEDRERFLQGQLTNDLNLLRHHESQITCRLDRTGRLISFFHLAKMSDHLLILVEKKLTAKTIEVLEKFIISEDVEISIWDMPYQVVLTPFNLELIEGEYFKIMLYGESGYVFWGNNLEKTKKFPFLNLERRELMDSKILSGYPLEGELGHLVNESYLNTIGVDYKKGCFLGKETVSKIENFKGASYFPVLLEVENFSGSDLVGQTFHVDGRKGGEIQQKVELGEQKFYRARLFRNFRVLGKTIELEFKNLLLKAKIYDLPFFKKNDSVGKASELYFRAVDLFHLGDEEGAKDLLNRSIEIDPSCADAYETMGVILGKQGDYLNAITWMDKLLGVDPDSILGHTNKSLYLMKLGRLEEAEEEKAKAMAKEFARLAKKDNDQKVNLEQDQLQQREKMFNDVLKLDEKDSIANFGIADIYFKRKNYQKSIKHLRVLLKADSDHARGYLLLGKCYLAMGQKDQAQSILQRGVHMASQKGEMVPANEMQRMLESL